MARKAKKEVGNTEVLAPGEAQAASDSAKSVSGPISKGEAKKLVKSITSLWKTMETSWYSLGIQVKTAIDRKAPEVMGFTRQSDWFEKFFGEKAKNVHRALRIARAFEKAPQQMVKRLTEGNAYDLSRLPENMRLDEEWLERAAKMKNQDFREAVEGALQKKGHPKPEAFINLFPKMPITFKPILDDIEGKLAELLNMDPGDKTNRFKRWELFGASIATSPVEVLRAMVQTDETDEAESAVAEEGTHDAPEPEEETQDEEAHEEAPEEKAAQA